MAPHFFIGLHQPSDAQQFMGPDDQVMVSVNRLRDRVGDFLVGRWMMDSGAFTELKNHGRYRHSPAEYAAQIRRWRRCGDLLAACSQDYMCEPFILGRTGLTLVDHQRLTIERYDKIRAALRSRRPIRRRGVSRPRPCLIAPRQLRRRPRTYLMPVIQGYQPSDYVAHIRQYGARLALGAWVGVGSVCKRNGDPRAIEAVLLAITLERPDLRLHGFGLKQTALTSPIVHDLLATCDSLAWSFAARYEGRNANDWREARAYLDKVDANPPDRLSLWSYRRAA
jgi:hypothetical protein